MNLQYKVPLALLVVTLLSLSVVYYSILKYDAAFKEVLGEQAAEYADAIMHEIDREIYEKITESAFHGESLYIVEEIQESNRLFESMQDRENYINKIEFEWASNSTEINKFIEGLLGNKGSIRLRDIQEFYSVEGNSTSYPEIFVTNRYGALVSSTGKTSDYLQNDEEWWLKAKENGFYAEEPIYDESSKATGLVIASRIRDKQGNFIGVIKGIVSKELLKKKIEDASTEKYNNLSDTKEIKLLTKEGVLIYQSKNTPYNIGDFSNYSFFKKLKGKHGHILTKEEWHEEDKNEEIMISYAKSEGYSYFRGFGWMVIIENESEEVLSPAKAIKNNLIIFSLIFMLALVAAGTVFSHKMTHSLRTITEESRKISSGNLDASIRIDSKDEVGTLAITINNMVTELKKSKNQLEEVNKNLEEKVKQRTKELEEKNKELEKFNKLAVGRELKMVELKKEIKELKEAKDGST